MSNSQTPLPSWINDVQAMKLRFRKRLAIVRACIKISQLRHLIAAAERGSIHGAARHLGIAQPTISRSLQDLERELGVTHFERSRAGMLPTTIGKVVVRRAKAMAAELDRTLAEVAHYKKVWAQRS